MPSPHAHLVPPDTSYHSGLSRCAYFAITFSIFLISLLSLNACQSNTFQIPASVDASRSSAIRIATSGDYLPFSQWAPGDADPAGFSVNLAHAFAASQGLEIEWVRFRWPDLLGALVADQFDIALSGITVRPDRSTAGRFSLPVTTSAALVLVPNAAAAQMADDLDAAGIRLAVNAGGHLERVARRFFPKARVIAIPRNQDVLAELAEGRVDGVVTDSLEAPHWQARAPELRRIGPLTQDRKAALFPAGQGDLAQRFDAWILTAERDGQLADLRAQHGLPETRTARPVAALLASLDERLSLMPAVARVKQRLDRPIEDLGRESQVVEAAWRSVEARAEAVGKRAPTKEKVVALFRAQIEAAKWIQAHTPIEGDGGAESESEMDHRRASARRELEESLRPALIRLGDRIARLVIELGSTAENGTRAGYVRPGDALEDTQRAITRHGLPRAHVQALHAALVSLRPIASPSASSAPPTQATPGTAPTE